MLVILLFQIFRIHNFYWNWRKWCKKCYRAIQQVDREQWNQPNSSENFCSIKNEHKALIHYPVFYPLPAYFILFFHFFHSKIIHAKHTLFDSTMNNIKKKIEFLFYLCSLNANSLVFRVFELLSLLSLLMNALFYAVLRFFLLRPICLTYMCVFEWTIFCSLHVYENVYRKQ